MKGKGYSFRDISESTNRSVSTICDEWHRGKVRRKYDSLKAHHKAYVRRWRSKYQGMKIVRNTNLQNFVEQKLFRDDSPVNISGRLKRRERKLPYVSKNSIYRYIDSPYGRRIETYRNKKNQRRRSKRPKGKKLQDRVFIDKRPLYINERKRIGDVEGDFLDSGRSGKGKILVIGDRKSRVPFLEKILPVSISNVHKAAERIKERFPEWKTMTTDNDLLFARHKELEELLNIKIYFCHQYHSWEKGTIEKINREIRRDIPKGSNISKYSKRFIQTIEDKLQTKIYKVLDYQTPLEVLEKHRRRKKRHGAEKKNKS